MWDGIRAVLTQEPIHTGEPLPIVQEMRVDMVHATLVPPGTACSQNSLLTYWLFAIMLPCQPGDLKGANMGAVDRETILSIVDDSVVEDEDAPPWPGEMWIPLNNWALPMLMPGT